MRAVLLAALAALSLSACDSVAERSARSSGVGFAVSPTPDQAPTTASGDYRAAFNADLASGSL